MILQYFWLQVRIDGHNLIFSSVNILQPKQQTMAQFMEILQMMNCGFNSVAKYSSQIQVFNLPSDAFYQLNKITSKKTIRILFQRWQIL